MPTSNNSRLLAEGRRRKILELVEQTGQVTIHDVVKRFAVSELVERLAECPFCSGPLGPAGYSDVGGRSYHFAKACYGCKASVRIYTPGCAAIPW